MDPEYRLTWISCRKAILRLQPGEISHPIRAKTGSYLLQRVDEEVDIRYLDDRHRMVGSDPDGFVNALRSGSLSFGKAVKRSTGRSRNLRSLAGLSYRWLTWTKRTPLPGLGQYWIRCEPVEFRPRLFSLTPSGVPAAWSGWSYSTYGLDRRAITRARQQGFGAEERRPCSGGCRSAGGRQVGHSRSRPARSVDCSPPGAAPGGKALPGRISYTPLAR